MLSKRLWRFLVSMFLFGGSLFSLIQMMGVPETLFPETRPRTMFLWAMLAMFALIVGCVGLYLARRTDPDEPMF
jgi:hypothetical protein